ncbi:uncharacterized protein PHACADRAFT_31548 [Phanerochaete carnosa HHB-10118-sp]|uniref:Uncharacterized protein n=1 Tax=Phanerochaete carnosa (strain HHB-10118-sp) TaxID=650164 RepID=K5VY37_PHACS|nr:uncharacterized protein PHACADRAFT_31548 [Phanerochaete carnosa HHB-10118-sp]EKM51730.1 hypothetical protein PHACADRAFT_31548 [Phanerochaete carnosa HHB-10118-sp]
MSFLIGADGLLRDQWPRFVGRPLLDDLDADTAESWQMVPVSEHDLGLWAKVVGAGQDTTGCKRFRLVYKTKDDIQGFNRPSEVRLRLQGVVKKWELGPLGDWEGSKCLGAAQRLELYGDFAPEVFAVQLDALFKLVNFIGRMLRCDRVCADYRNESVRAGRVCSALLDDDDPEYLARRVQEEWVITHRPGYLLETDDGDLVETTPHAFHVGDFVDVAVTYDILTRVVRGVKTAEISIGVEDVLRLHSKQSIKVSIDDYVTNACMLMVLQKIEFSSVVECVETTQTSSGFGIARERAVV